MGGKVKVIIPPIFKFALFKKLVAVITGSVCNVYIISFRLAIDDGSGHVWPGLSLLYLEKYNPLLLNNTSLYSTCQR